MYTVGLRLTGVDDHQNPPTDKIGLMDVTNDGFSEVLSGIGLMGMKCDSVKKMEEKVEEILSRFANGTEALK